jgi:hypothetical protein
MKGDIPGATGEKGVGHASSSAVTQWALSNGAKPKKCQLQVVDCPNLSGVTGATERIANALGSFAALNSLDGRKGPVGFIRQRHTRQIARCDWAARPYLAQHTAFEWGAATVIRLDDFSFEAWFKSVDEYARRP